MSGSPRRLEATLLLVGTIVGVGMFGIPFVFSRAGFLTGAVELVLLAAITMIVHLAYAEVVLRTPEIHRLPGYASRYLGPAGAAVSRLSYLFGISGALLVYLVLGGAFLGTLLAAFLPRLPEAVGPAAFYLAGASVVLRGIRFESLANAVLTLGLIFALVLGSALLLSRASVSALSGFDLSRVTVPYGVLLFSLAGAAIIPNMRRALGSGTPRVFAATVVWGTLIAAVLYLLFSLAVVGATGAATTPDAIRGVAERFGPFFGLLGSAVGFLATITSFITLSVVLEGMFTTDFRLRAAFATSITLAIPAVLFAAGFRDFITIIGFVGAVAVGIDSILILLIHRRAQARYAGAVSFRLRIPGAWRAILVLMFLVGVAFEFFVDR